MRSSFRYLNTMLTLVAILLSLTLWTWWTQSPLAEATVSPARAQGILEAGLQRKDMIDRLDMLNGKMDALIELLRSGQVRVRVEDDAHTESAAAGPAPRTERRFPEASDE